MSTANALRKNCNKGSDGGETIINQGQEKDKETRRHRDKETKAGKLKPCEASLTNVRPLGTMHVKPGLPEGSNPSKGWTERYLSRRCMELPPRERGDRTEGRRRPQDKNRRTGGNHKTRTDQPAHRRGATYN